MAYFRKSFRNSYSSGVRRKARQLDFKVDKIPPSTQTCRKYGITKADYTQMYHEQDGKCYICRKPPRTRRLAIDHQHHAHVVGNTTVRGLLCSSCNYGLGFFKDDPERLARASEYLRRPRPQFGSVIARETRHREIKARQDAAASTYGLTMDMPMLLQVNHLARIKGLSEIDIAKILMEFNNCGYIQTTEVMDEARRLGYSDPVPETVSAHVPF